MIILFSNKEKYLQKISEIYETINKLTNENKEIGLLNGMSGISLFNFYYSHYVKQEEPCNIALNIIGHVFDKIAKKNIYHTFCTGLGGVGWTIEHLIQNNFMDGNTNEILKESDEYLFGKMLYDIKNNNYDFLHGAIGNGLYFLNRLSNPESETYLIQLIDELEKLSIKEKDGSIKWESIVLDANEEPKKVFNLSLSHGMASIIAFLAKSYSKNIHKDKAKFLIEGAVKFLLKYKLDTNTYHSNFPSWVCNNEELSGSRLAWCYGDLGIAVALYQAAKALQNNDWEKIALEVLLHSTTRKDVQKEGVLDAGLCHGSTGIAHIYHRMYLNTGIEQFKDSSGYWFDVTLKIAKYNDGLAGYKAFRTEKYGGPTKEYGVLEGIAGIGLALISAVSDIEPKWDECLLLS